MEKGEAYRKDIESIRQLMERSVKFISLSGLSGIFSGIYALLGALIAATQLPGEGFRQSYELPDRENLTYRLLLIAAAVLIASISTGLWLSTRKAKRLGTRIWDHTAKRLAINLSIPLLTGGIFILIQLQGGHPALVAPSCLIFYGLALVNAAPNLYDEVRYLGYSEIILGLACAALPGYGLQCWAAGFGVFHILYGAIMYRKYEA